MILTLTGASGAGKTTLSKALVNLLPSAELSPGCTTRELRPDETPADVNHLSQQEFSEMHQRGEFLWAIEVHGNWYGTLRQIVVSALSIQEHCLLLILTSDVLPILRDFAKEYGQSEAIRSIYVLSPEPTDLRARLIARELDSNTINRRLADCLTWDRAAYRSGLYDLLIPGEGDVNLNAMKVINSLFLDRRAY